MQLCLPQASCNKRRAACNASAAALHAVSEFAEFATCTARRVVERIVRWRVGVQNAVDDATALATESATWVSASTTGALQHVRLGLALRKIG